MENRPGSARRISRTSHTACAVTAAATRQPPARITGHRSKNIPPITPTAPRLRQTRRSAAGAPRFASGSRRTEAAKWPDQITIALVTAPSSSAWTSSQKACGRKWWAVPTAAKRPSQATTIAFTARCQRVRGERPGGGGLGADPLGVGRDRFVVTGGSSGCRRAMPPGRGQRVRGPMPRRGAWRGRRRWPPIRRTAARRRC